MEKVNLTGLFFNTTDTTNYVEMYSNNTPVFVKDRKGEVKRIGE